VFRTVTFTPGTTAPVESVTVPTTVAVPVDCAINATADNKTSKSRDNMVPSRND
jgi:hypothetical protein